MKKIQYFFVLLLMGTITVISCQKEKAEVKDEQNNTEVSKITRQLQAFKQNLQLKSDETMTADSAEWYLEGLLNYEKANNTHDFGDVDFFHDTLTLTVIDGQISLSELNGLYASISEWAGNLQQQSGNENYTFDVVDLTIEETGLKSGEKNLVVALSGGLPGTTPSYIGFGSDDYWTSGGLQGKCDIYSGQFVGRDATTELEDHFTFVATIPSYYVSISNVIAPAILYETTDNPYGDYMIWVENENHSNNCLSPGELNYYLSKWDYIKTINKPANKAFITVDVIIDCIVGSGSNFYTYKLKYGINIGSNPN